MLVSLIETPPRQCLSLPSNASSAIRDRFFEDRLEPCGNSADLQIRLGVPPAPFGETVTDFRGIQKLYGRNGVTFSVVWRHHNTQRIAFEDLCGEITRRDPRQNSPFGA